MPRTSAEPDCEFAISYQEGDDRGVREDEAAEDGHP